MNPYEEGAQAAKDGLRISDCPYSYSKMAPIGGIEQYLTEEFDKKRNAWARGWHSVKIEQRKEPT
jgi:hypothetical protein